MNTACLCFLISFPFSNFFLPLPSFLSLAYSSSSIRFFLPSFLPSFLPFFPRTSRQLDAFLTTLRVLTHEGTTGKELYSAAAATTNRFFEGRWKGDKQLRCKRAAPFHLCLTSNLLRRRLMKETWSDRPLAVAVGAGREGRRGGREADESVGSCVTCVDTSTFNVSPMDRALTIR